MRGSTRSQVLAPRPHPCTQEFPVPPQLCQHGQGSACCQLDAQPRACPGCSRIWPGGDMGAGWGLPPCWGGDGERGSCCISRPALAGPRVCTRVCVSACVCAHVCVSAEVSAPPWPGCTSCLHRRELMPRRCVPACAGTWAVPPPLPVPGLGLHSWGSPSLGPESSHQPCQLPHCKASSTRGHPPSGCHRRSALGAVRLLPGARGFVPRPLAPARVAGLLRASPGPPAAAAEPIQLHRAAANRS